MSRRPVSGELRPPDLQLIASVADDLPVGVWVARASRGEFVYANRAFTEIMGMSARADVALGAYAAPYGIRTKTGEPYPEDELPFARALARRETVMVDDIVIHRHDGGRVHVRAFARPVFGEAGEITHVVIAFVDITREALAEAARLQADRERDEVQARLVQLDRMISIGTLAASVAHEVNNPLAYLIVSLEVMERELRLLERELASGSPGRAAAQRIERVQTSLRDAHEGAERVRVIVRDLRTFARGDEERLVAVDVRRVLAASIHMTSNESRHKARVVTSLGEVPDVLANEARLGQVFLNLLINAAQALPEGSPDANEIRVTTSADDQGRAVVEIADTGAGIAPEVIGRIFDPFFTTKPVGAGTGLGLSVCRNIVTAVGGEIGVRSELGAGTVVRVILPAAGEHAPRAAEPVARGRASGRRARILLVDDDEALARALRDDLHDEHDVHVATSGRDALALLLAGERFDLILCDLMMPGLSGMDLHAELRARRPGLETQLLFITGGAFTARAREFLAAVSNACFEKPFEVRPIIEAVMRDRRR